jgi:NodT family efflux transporter outer membrane factor (OMF) lipoprotein
MTHRCSYIAVIAGLSTLLNGCSVGPDFTRPKAPEATRYEPKPLLAQTAAADVPLGASQHFDANMDVPYDWWTLYRSPYLDQLVQRAFAHNPSIEAAQAALQQAQEFASAQQGYFYPTVTASYSPSRSKLAGNMGGNSPGVQGNGRVIQTYSNPAGPKYNGPAYYNFHVAQLTVGYVPDVFGLNRRLVESSQAQVENQRLQLEATYLTLASNVVAAAIQEASLRAQLEAVQRIVAIDQESLDILRKQNQLGYISGMEVAAQEYALASAEQSQLPLKKQLDQTRNLLLALVGGTPDHELEQSFTLACLQLPQQLPVSLPSKIVEQRPDVRAAEEQLHYASAQAGVAVANTLPQFAIAAGLGGMAATPDWMFKTGGGFFNIAASVSQTLFDGGTLRARSRAAEQALLQAGAQYRGTVISALQNVADALYTVSADAEALQAAAKTAQAAQTMYDLSRKQYQVGQSDYLSRLVAEQNYQVASINLIQAQTNRLGDTAALFQAMGGGWWNRPSTTAAAPAAIPDSASSVPASATP